MQVNMPKEDNSGCIFASIIILFFVSVFIFALFESYSKGNASFKPIVIKENVQVVEMKCLTHKEQFIRMKESEEWSLWLDQKGLPVEKDFQTKSTAAIAFYLATNK